MSTNKRTLSFCLAILAALLFLTACSALPQKTGKREIRSVADRIAGYTVPKGYSEQFAIDMLGYQLVSLQGPTPNCHIYLVQAPKDVNVDVAALESQARELEGQKSQDDRRGMRVVETRTATVRGESVSLVVREGVNSVDAPYREVTGLFTGRSGPALVSVAAPADQWNWDLVNEFLSSIE